MTEVTNSLDVVDNDSALGDDDLSAITSLATTLLRHREELGRTYHKFRANETQYWGPNDEQQNRQLDIGHYMLLLLLKNELLLAPIGDECGKAIDLGCGTGIWAIDFADAHPECHVIGVDLSPIQPAWVPPNCEFLIDDITDEWIYEDNEFDLVNLRCLIGSVQDWRQFYKQIYRKIRPGGWIHHLEISMNFESDDGTVDDDHFLNEWSRALIESGVRSDKTWKTASFCADFIRATGFENVEEKWYKLPVGSWPKDPKLKQIGKFNYHYCMEGCEGWAIYPLVKVLKWSVEEAQLFIARFRDELKNRRNHAYYRVVVVYGQKPQEVST